MDIDELFLPEFFGDDRAFIGKQDRDDIGMWLFDEEDESFQRALHAMNQADSLFQDVTDNELDASSSTTESSDGHRVIRSKKTSVLPSKRTAAEAQTLMNEAMTAHLTELDMTNPASTIFEGVDPTSLFMETELLTNKRLRTEEGNAPFSGFCLPITTKVPTGNTNPKRCEEPGCFKFPQGSTRYCISHGGGRRCTFENCTKGARDRYFCAAHGGGRRCATANCGKSAVGGSHLCATHGGGRKCNFEGCSKSAQSPTSFCVMHGGGKKCNVPGCTKVSRGKTQFCASHGGGVRCETTGCIKAAIAKSKYCRSHASHATSSDSANEGSP